jgi:AcrR family transcriptional regulator
VTDVTSRRPGRPRDARVDDVIREAAAEVLAEHGAAGFSIDAVAARAGVGKATIYRRWPSRAELLLDTAHFAVADVPDPDTGSVREDLVLITSGLLGKMRDTAAGQLMPAVMAEAAVNEEMRDTLARFVAQRRERAVHAVQRGIDRGELRPDIDPHLVVDLVAGPVFLRRMLTSMPMEDGLAERAVDAVLEGIAIR